ncbi:hypothetical protein [Marinicella rhabdoformis]|uniref:hypothetical protein n=1 Tax=Marinicella rhabdoformis TaxID=2580566 RepID=UPI0012AEBE0A|nr:hypothetical protein [Marinicella rhabdoformis]
MFELYINEIKRLKMWAFIPCLAFLLLNTASIYFGEYADSGLMIGNVHSVIFAVVTLLLGLVQFHPYKNSSAWLYLINRPVSNTSLCLTLVSAAATIIFFQFVFTDIMITLVMDNVSDFLIESRHYRQAVYIFFVSLGFYLSGVYIRLCHSKGAFLVIIFPVFVIASLLLGGPSIGLSFFSAAWLLLLVISVFKANINNNQTHLWGKVLAVIPYQLAMFLIVGMLITFSIQMKNMLINGAGVDIPWNEYFPNDTYSHVVYLEGNEQLGLTLEEANKTIKARYQSQLLNVETTPITRNVNASPSVNLLPYQQRINNLSILDNANNKLWTFSFDQMLFLNTDSSKNKETRLGIQSEDGETTAFDQIPTAINRAGYQQVITEQQLHFYDPDLESLTLRMTVPSDETILSTLNKTGTLMALITTKNLYFFNANQVKNTAGMLTPTTVIALPGAHENIGQIEVAEMMDSTLVSFLFGKNSSTGLFPAEQIAIEVDSSSNHVSILATRPLKHGFSELYHHLGWMISPLTNWVYQYQMVPLIKAKSIKPESLTGQLKLSSQFKLIIALLTLTAVFLVIWISGKRSKTATERWAWIGLTCFTGIIGLFTFLLLSDSNQALVQSHNEDKS